MSSANNVYPARSDDIKFLPRTLLDKARATLVMFEQGGFASELDVVAKLEIDDFMRHAVRQIEQTRRRVVLGETIAHDEKVFSIFEPHTEWISKGKAGVPVELGVKVCILEDQLIPATEPDSRPSIRMAMGRGQG